MLLVAGAAAEGSTAARQADFSYFADVGLLLHASCAASIRNPWRAEAALQAMMRHEGALQRMQSLAVGQTLDRADFLAAAPAWRTSNTSARPCHRRSPCKHRRRRVRNQRASRSTRNPREWRRPASCAPRRAHRMRRGPLTRQREIDLSRGPLFTCPDSLSPNLPPHVRLNLLRGPHHDREGVAAAERLAGVDDDAGVARVLLRISHRVECRRPAAAQDFHALARIATRAHRPDHAVPCRTGSMSSSTTTTKRLT